MRRCETNPHGLTHGWTASLLRQLLLAWFITFLGFPSEGLAESNASSISERQALEFLAAVTGAWQGEAVRTPRGPRPYDMQLVRQADGAVAGQANPGAAIHHWRFYFEEGRLKLRFLTTFQGNSAPLLLRASTAEDKRVVFVAPDPKFLQVAVVAASDEIAIEIRLHGEAHVSIRLKRALPPA